MTITEWLRRIHGQPAAWVRVDRATRGTRGLDLEVSVAKKRRGPTDTKWRISCQRVREFQLEDLDGGGIQLSTSDHPAARQYTDPTVSIRPRIPDVHEALGVLFETHTSSVDDWIPFDRYLRVAPPSPKKIQELRPRGPLFLMRAYAAGLRRAGLAAQMSTPTVRRRRPQSLRVLHFGNSFVVAAVFDVQAL